jgi:hypothetical protein
VREGDKRRVRSRSGACAAARGARLIGARLDPHDGFDERVPGLAGSALAFPPEVGSAACLTDEAALRPSHGAGLGDFGGDLRLGGVDRETRVRLTVDDDRRARLVAPEQEVLGEDVLDQVLDHATHRAGAE